MTCTAISAQVCAFKAQVCAGLQHSSKKLRRALAMSLVANWRVITGMVFAIAAVGDGKALGQPMGLTTVSPTAFQYSNYPEQFTIIPANSQRRRRELCICISRP
jgi:hypothetical protein